jgi:DEP domain-containing protein 5
MDVFWQTTTAYMTSQTKIIYRSLSAKTTLFIQVCRELWEFAGDGERYNEKIVHSFLPALFSKWRESGTTHIVTIVLISRVFYDESELEYAAGPLRRDDDGRWYKDFFKVTTDLEVLYDWKPTLTALKDSFWAFQRDILLAHHHHRASQVSSLEAPDNVRLVGRLSYAHDGPVLEALNLSFNPMETHYVDRSLSLTGSATVIITPGSGYYRVSKDLLRLTTTRILDQGFAIDLVSLNKPPLHQSPIFSFTGTEPSRRSEVAVRPSSLRLIDTLWGDEDEHGERNDRKRTTFWWEPFWMSVSFWDKQMDLPFREDRQVCYDYQTAALE